MILFRNKADAFFCECSYRRKNGTFKIWSAYTAETASEVPKVQTDNRPHEQRVTKPRKARRLNHSFMHLYRHDSRLFDDTKIASGSRTLSFPRVYLKEYGGYTDGDIDEMSLNFPPLSGGECPRPNPGEVKLTAPISHPRSARCLTVLRGTLLYKK